MGVRLPVESGRDIFQDCNAGLGWAARLVPAPVRDRFKSGWGRLNGLDLVIPVYASLEAAAAGVERQDPPAEPQIVELTRIVPGTTDPIQAVDQANRAGELLGWVADRLFDIGVLLERVHEPPGDAASSRLAEALRGLDDVVREVRHHMFAEHAPAARSSFARRSSLDTHHRLTKARDRAAELREHVARTAHALQSAAADTAALLQQQAGPAGQPARIDYPTEARRWRALADQAEQMAEQREQRP